MSDEISTVAGWINKPKFVSAFDRMDAKGKNKPEEPAPALFGSVKVDPPPAELITEAEVDELFAEVDAPERHQCPSCGRTAAEGHNAVCTIAYGDRVPDVLMGVCKTIADLVEADAGVEGPPKLRIAPPEERDAILKAEAEGMARSAAEKRARGEDPLAWAIDGVPLYAIIAESGNVVGWSKTPNFEGQNAGAVLEPSGEYRVYGVALDDPTTYQQAHAEAARAEQAKMAAAAKFEFQASLAAWTCKDCGRLANELHKSDCPQQRPLPPLSFKTIYDEVQKIDQYPAGFGAAERAELGCSCPDVDRVDPACPMHNTNTRAYDLISSASGVSSKPREATIKNALDVPISVFGRQIEPGERVRVTAADARDLGDKALPRDGEPSMATELSKRIDDEFRRVRHGGDPLPKELIEKAAAIKAHSDSLFGKGMYGSVAQMLRFEMKVPLDKAKRLAEAVAVHEAHAERDPVKLANHLEHRKAARRNAVLKTEVDLLRGEVTLLNNQLRWDAGRLAEYGRENQKLRLHLGLSEVEAGQTNYTDEEGAIERLERENASLREQLGVFSQVSDLKARIAALTGDVQKRDGVISELRSRLAEQGRLFTAMTGALDALRLQIEEFVKTRLGATVSRLEAEKYGW